MLFYDIFSIPADSLSLLSSVSDFTQFCLFCAVLAIFSWCDRTDKRSWVHFTSGNALVLNLSGPIMKIEKRADQTVVAIPTWRWSY